MLRGGDAGWSNALAQGGVSITTGSSCIPRAAASLTTLSVRSKLGAASGVDCASLQENTVRTDSTPVLAISAHCSSCTSSGAFATEPPHIVPKKPCGTLRRASAEGAAAMSAMSARASDEQGAGHDHPDTPA